MLSDMEAASVPADEISFNAVTWLGMSVELRFRAKGFGLRV